MSQLEEDRKKIREAYEHGRAASKLECTQEMFNDGIMDALASLRKGEMTHDERVDFLLWAEKQIQEEMKKDK